jgi:hypothetical protein
VNQLSIHSPFFHFPSGDHFFLVFEAANAFNCVVEFGVMLLAGFYGIDFIDTELPSVLVVVVVVVGFFLIALLAFIGFGTGTL